jgi:hypothetical protein
MPTNESFGKIFYGIKGVPLFTYGMIGITTIVLAYITFTDIGDITSEEQNENQIETPIDTINPVNEIEKQESQLLSKEGEIPSGEGEIPSGEGEIPSGEGEMPSGEGEIPSGEEEIPSGEGEIPSGEVEIPTEEGEISSEQQEEKSETSITGGKRKTIRRKSKKYRKTIRK